MKKLKIVFFGTPEFATYSLNELFKNKFIIQAVVTATDKKSGRGKKLQYSHVKEYCLEYNINLLQPVSLKSTKFLRKLKLLQTDLFVVVAYRMLPSLVWQIPKIGTINLHASILPQLRGAAPIQWAIINGLSETGLTTFFINEKIDSGDVLLQNKVKIAEDENFGSLHDKLMLEGGKLLVSTIKLLESKKYKAMKQNLEKTHLTAPKLDKNNTRINWKKSGIYISNLIRGLSPFPGAWTQILGSNFTIKIFSAFYIESGTNSSIRFKIEKNKLMILIRDGHLEIDEIQIEGKKRMNSKEFINGYRNFNNVELY